MRIDHRCAHVRMPQQLLNCSDIRTALQQMRRKTVPQRVRAHRFCQSGPQRSAFHQLLNGMLIQMMPPFHIRPRIDGQRLGGKQPEPA